MKKLFAILLAVMMIAALAVPAFAQDVGTAANDTATITVNNPAKGETYTLIRLFDATTQGTGDNAVIAYTGDIPTALSTYFEKTSGGNVAPTEAAGSASEMSTALASALKDWAAAGATGAAQKYDAVTSDGSTLQFKGYPYGYYVVYSSQGAHVVTVASTMPNASIFDKNTTEPKIEEGDGKKIVTSSTGEDGATTEALTDSTVMNIGDTINYRVTFTTSNWITPEGAAADGSGAKQVINYVITDTPATNSLTNIVVDSITIGGAEYKVENQVPQFVSGSITIPWVDGTTSLYANSAKVVINYHATVADTAAIAGNGNTNTVQITANTTDSSVTKTLEDTATFKTYAVAIKKVNTSGTALSGAVFSLPFYVKSEAADDGAYIYAGTEAGDGLVNSLTTPESGVIVIKGVKDGTYNIQESTAPRGYNKIDGDIAVPAVVTTETTTSVTKYLDAQGNVTDTETNTTVTYRNENIAANPTFVVNYSGTVLPSTGGIGTTIFYVIGGVMVLAAGVLLITKKRLSQVED